MGDIVSYYIVYVQVLKKADNLGVSFYTKVILYQ